MTRHRNWLRQEPKDFKGKSLRNKKFTKRYLFDADFRELDLNGALFDEAMLEGARGRRHKQMRGSARGRGGVLAQAIGDRDLSLPAHSL